MTVSNEDREAALQVLDEHWPRGEWISGGECSCGAMVESWHAHFLAALVSHGWEPKQSVSTTELA